MRVLFISRGRGHGHAIPDYLIGSRLRREHGFEVTFSSYDTGLRTLRAFGEDAIDLEMNERRKYLESVLASQKVIAKIRPDVVVAHEEFGAVFAAATIGTPSIFLSAWMPPPTGIFAESLLYACSIVLLAPSGVQEIPPLNCSPVCTGFLVRNFDLPVDTREQTRVSLSISHDSLVILAMPGGAARNMAAEWSELVFSAFEKIDRSDKVLLWAGAPREEGIRKRLAGIKEARIVEFTPAIERLLSVSDVIVTRGTRGVALDAAAVGVASVALSMGDNPVDDLLGPFISHHRRAFFHKTTAEQLRDLLVTEARLTPRPKLASNESEIVNAILGELRRVFRSTNGSRV